MYQDLHKNTVITVLTDHIVFALAICSFPLENIFCSKLGTPFTVGWLILIPVVNFHETLLKRNMNIKISSSHKNYKMKLQEQLTSKLNRVCLCNKIDNIAF